MIRKYLLALILCLLSIPAIAGLDGVNVPFNPAAFDPAGAAATAQANAIAGAPVLSVNQAVGNVTVPSICRQQSTALSIPTTNPATVSWTFPNTTCTFAAAPTCWVQITSTSNSLVFDFPQNTSASTTSTTFTFTSHGNSLSVLALGLLSITVSPPTGATAILTCTSAPQ